MWITVHGSQGVQVGRTGTSPQLLRRTNTVAVLEVMREAGVVTVTELIAATGLVRTTVIAVCDDLLRMGWIEELEGASDAQVGRPARLFRFRDRAGFVVGVDRVGQAAALAEHGADVVVQDLAELLGGEQ